MNSGALVVVEIVLSLESVVVVSSIILSIVVSDVLIVPKSSGTKMVLMSVIPEVSIPKMLRLSKFSVLKLLSFVSIVLVVAKSSVELKVPVLPNSSIELKVPGELKVPVFSLTRVVPSGPVVSINEDVPVIVKLLVSSTDFTGPVPVLILLLNVPFSWQRQ